MASSDLLPPVIVKSTTVQRYQARLAARVANVPNELSVLPAVAAHQEGPPLPGGQANWKKLGTIHFGLVNSA